MNLGQKKRAVRILRAQIAHAAAELELIKLLGASDAETSSGHVLDHGRDAPDRRNDRGSATPRATDC